MAAEDDPHWYFGTSYMSIFAKKVAGTNENFRTDALNLRMGYDFTNWLALETGIAKSSTSDPSSAGLTYRVDELAYGGLRLNLRLEKFVPFVFGGTAYVSDTSCDPGCVNGVQGTAIVGGGFDIYGTKDTAINFTALAYDTKRSKEQYSLSLGFTWYFDFVGYAPRY